mgnify:CR=1 FL=1
MTRVLIGIVFLCSEFIQAQDVHYSQFDKTTSLLNPSLIAHQNDDYEIQLQRRSQWSSVTTPFNTFSAAFNIRDVYNSLSSGIMILNDIAGDSYFSTNGLSLSFANSFNTKHNLFAVGVQAAFYQRSINYDKLVFLQNEFLGLTSFSFFDIGIGVSNYKRIGIKSGFLLGISSFHLNKPKQSLELNEEVFLSPKHILHSSYYSSLGAKVDVFPAIYASLQNQETELIIGSGLTYKLNDKFNLNSGVYSRIKDAVFITLGMQNEKLSAMISYDINISTLANASNYMGGTEISISYTWSINEEKNEEKPKICPKYL